MERLGLGDAPALPLLFNRPPGAYPGLLPCFHDWRQGKGEHDELQQSDEALAQRQEAQADGYAHSRKLGSIWQAIDGYNCGKRKEAIQMSSKAASLRHAKNAQKLDEYAPEEKLKGMFSRPQRFTIKDWLARREAQGKPIGYGHSGQIISKTMRKANA